MSFLRTYEANIPMPMYGNDLTFTGRWKNLKLSKTHNRQTHENSSLQIKTDSHSNLIVLFEKIISKDKIKCLTSDYYSSW